MRKPFLFFFSGLLAGILLTVAFMAPRMEPEAPPGPVPSATLVHPSIVPGDAAAPVSHPQPPAPTDDHLAIHSELKAKYDQLLEEHGRISSYLLIDDLPMAIVSTTVSGQKELVVYAALPPKENDLERKIVILRLVNQIFRDHQNIQRISIWDDESTAQTYARGEYDHGQTVTGWQGLDHRAAYVTKDQQGVRVQYALSRDDFENIWFGMSRLPE